MKALVYEGPWQMPLREVEPPQANPGEVVVKVRAVGVCGSDVHGYTGVTGRRKPPIVMGHEFSGVVTSLGEGVNSYKEGDRVVVQPLLTCGRCDNCRAGLLNICLNRGGLGMNMPGAYAEMVRVPQRMLYSLSTEMSWEQGAMVEPLAVALHAVNLTPFSFDDTLVIIGAGTIGLLTLVCARLRGAGKIVVTDLSEHRLAVAKSLGADIALNAGEQDPLEVVRAETGGKGAAAAIEAVGVAATVKQSLEVVRPGGYVTWIGNSHPIVEVNMQQVVTRELTIRGAYGFNEEFARAIELIRDGRVDVTPLIEKVAPLDEGPQIIHDLASGEMDCVKVILRP